MQEGKKYSKIILYIFLTVYSFLIIVPMMVAVIPTFQTAQESSRGIFTMPSHFSFDNYKQAWVSSNFPVAFRNSVIISFGTILLNIFLGSLAAFPIGIRRKNKHLQRIFVVFLVGLMLPFQSVMIPLYTLMGHTLKLSDTYIGIILVYLAMTLPLTVFFYSQFIASIPKEMEEAAVLDGCGYFYMLWKIYFPLLKPVTAAIVIEHILFLWNDLLVPLVLIDSPQKKPLMPTVYMFFGSYSSQYNLAFSVLVLGALPLLLLFIIMQKQFISGMSQGAVKG